MQTFKDALKAIMDERGLTQDGLAELLDYEPSQNTISKYLAGKVKDPGIVTIIKISKALKVPVSYFYPDVGGAPSVSGKPGPVPERIFEHLLTENENLWDEKKGSTQKELSMLKMLEHLILRTPGSNIEGTAHA